MTGDAEQTWTPNQVVAFNLRRAREVKGWTQEEFGRQLAPYLGAPWSKALVSQAERSVDGVRIRPFDADELVAFSRALEMPITYFFLPPDDERQTGTPPLSPAQVITWLLAGLLDHSGSTEELAKRLGAFRSEARRDVRKRMREAAANSIHGRVAELRVALEHMYPALQGLAEATQIVGGVVGAAGTAQSKEAVEAMREAVAEAEEAAAEAAKEEDDAG